MSTRDTAKQESASLASEDSKTSIIKAVRNPLAFLTLGLLIVDATLASLIVALPSHQSLLVWSIIISFAVFVCIVVVLSIVRPEALKGDRPWQHVYSSRFAE